MSDPLDALADSPSRRWLLQLRNLDGTVRTSAQLRALLPGFKGQKGIYKPRGAVHALWVRQTLRKVYPDKEPVVNPDGSWVYDYSAEGRGGRPDLSLPTNRALLKCQEDGIPVGVIRQVASAQGPRTYEVRGLGYVTGFDGEHFRIRGEPIDVSARPVESPTQLQFEPFDRTLPSLAATLRQNRAFRFRLAVRRVYHERCGLCNIGYRIAGAPVALEAAHVIPVDRMGTSKDVRNGILLCSNHHALFDGFAWTLDEDFRVRVTENRGFRESAASNHVVRAEGHRLPNLPDEITDRPDAQAIRFRTDLFERHQPV